MARSARRGRALMACAALLVLAACAQPPRTGASPQIRDDTQGYDHPDRGMRDSHTM